MIGRLHYMDWLSAFAFAALAMHYQINGSLGMALILAVLSGVSAWVAENKISSRLLNTGMRRLFIKKREI